MKTLLILITLLLGLAVPVAAQTAITSTTLSAAITNPSPTTKTITVASATGISVGSILYIEGEVFRVTAVNGTTLTVLTQYRPATHLTSAVVFVVPVGAQYSLDPVGSCVRGGTGQFPANSPYTLMFNLTNGNIASCRGALGSRTWTLTNPYAVQLSSNPPATP